MSSRVAPWSLKFNTKINRLSLQTGVESLESRGFSGGILHSSAKREI